MQVIRQLKMLGSDRLGDAMARDNEILLSAKMENK